MLITDATSSLITCLQNYLFNTRTVYVHVHSKEGIYIIPTIFPLFVPRKPCPCRVLMFYRVRLSSRCSNEISHRSLDRIKFRQRERLDNVQSGEQYADVIRFNNRSVSCYCV